MSEPVVDGPPPPQLVAEWQASGPEDPDAFLDARIAQVVTEYRALPKWVRSSTAARARSSARARRSAMPLRRRILGRIGGTFSVAGIYISIGALVATGVTGRPWIGLLAGLGALIFSVGLVLDLRSRS